MASKISRKYFESYLLILTALLISTLSWGYIGFYCISILMFIRAGIRKNDKFIRQYFWLFLLPNIIIFFHSLASVLVYHETFYIARSVNNLLYISSCIAFAYSVFVLHKAKSIDLLVSATVSYYIIRIIEAIVSVGPIVFLSHILDLGSPVLTKWLEAHDSGLSLGLVIIYYIAFDKRRSKNRKCNLIASIIVFILCDKRIAIGGIIAVFLFRFFYHRKIDKRGKLTLIWGLAGVVICYAFVYFVRNEYILGWLWDHGIDTMGRTTIYRNFRKYYEFTPLFFGRGSGYTAKMLSLRAGTEFNRSNILALHSDILRAFIEYGFVGSGLWYIYYLLYLPRKMSGAGERYSEVMFIVALYSFIIYLTDNTANYMLFQTMYMLIPLCVWEKQGTGVMRFIADKRILQNKHKTIRIKVNKAKEV